VLDKIERQDYDVLRARPAISKFERARLLLGSLARLALSAGMPDELDRPVLRLLPPRGAQPRQEFLLLVPPAFRAAGAKLCAPSYAFMRTCDDFERRAGASRAALDQWRAAMEDALAGRFSGHPLWPAFHHTVRRFGIPHEYLREMIDGVVSDLEPRRFRTFDELYPLLLPGGFGGGPHGDSLFVSTRPARRTGGKNAELLFTHQYSGATSARIGSRPRSTCRKTTCALSRFPRRPGQRQSHSEFLRLMQFETIAPTPTYRESQPLLDLIHPRSRPSLWGVDPPSTPACSTASKPATTMFSGAVRLSSSRNPDHRQGAAG